MTILHSCVWDIHGLGSTTTDLHLADKTIPFDPTTYYDDPILIDHTPPASLSNNTRNPTEHIPCTQMVDTHTNHNRSTPPWPQTAPDSPPQRLPSLSHSLPSIPHTSAPPQEDCPRSKAPELPTLKDNFITTLKIRGRGLRKSQFDVQQIIAEHNPDVMALTETKLADKNHCPWLDKLLTKFKWWSAPHRSGGTIICVKHMT